MNITCSDETISSKKRFAVVIASKGRPSILRDTIGSIQRLNGAPKIVVVVPRVTDSCELSAYPEIETIVGPDGATFQRNAGISALDLDNLDVVFFFDDDVEVHPEYLTRVSATMDAHPEIVAGSGRPLRDGGVTREEARSAVACWQATGENHLRTEGKHWVLYGCNMFMRAAVLKNVRFDENLPSFAFAEDYEISIRLSRIGIVGRLNNAVCAHLKTPANRVDLRRVSYAMIANNFYFLHKGSVHLPHRKARLRFLYLALIHVPFLEVLRKCRGMPWSSRIQWWEGCARAWIDIGRGHCTPCGILRL